MIFKKYIHENGRVYEVRVTIATEDGNIVLSGCVKSHGNTFLNKANDDTCVKVKIEPGFESSGVEEFNNKIIRIVHKTERMIREWEKSKAITKNELLARGYEREGKED